MVFDFAARPPEVNSTLIYSGAGAGPMMAAATSFSSLSSELATNAAAYESVISQLTGGDWQGPSLSAMAAAAQQRIEGLKTPPAHPPEDRAQRGDVRRFLGSRPHRADHVRRQRCSRRAGDAVDRADAEHQPGWLGRA